MSALPFVFASFLMVLVVVLWPSHEQFGPVYLNWLNVALFALLALFFFFYGIVKLRVEEKGRASSSLRTKLIIAMVLMVLIPTSLLQVTANQVIEKGMDVWFDLRVDTLLDKAMKLAQGFYADIENDMELSLTQIKNDDNFPLEIISQPLGNMVVSQHLNKLLEQYGWEKAELFSLSERLIAFAQKKITGEELSDLSTRALSDVGKLTIALGRPTVEHETRDDGEFVVGYLPLYNQQRFVALLRAEIKLPEDITQSARSIEADYKSYRQLERHRQGIQDIFMHTLMIVMLIITSIAGLVALFFTRRLTMPIEELAAALQKVEDGDLNVEVPVHSQDELGSLAMSFNRMAARLQQNIQDLNLTQHDLTDALVSSRQRQFVLENLLSSLQSGVILLSETGEIRLMNQACQKLLFMHETNQAKTSIMDFSEVHLLPILEFFKTLQTQDLNTLQEEVEITYGLQTIKVLARGTRLGQDDSQIFSGWLLVFDDVTQLADAQKHQAWSEVAQRLAHEIKNPLTPIKLSTERVQRRFRNQVDDVKVFDTCTTVVINQVERLQRLLADFSNLATMPKPKEQIVHVETLLQDMRELYSAYSDLTFEGVPQGTIICDPDQIRQVLINLIDNALATKTHVRVYVEQGDEGIKLYVQDEGMGMDEQTRKHMFEPYYSTKKDGSGLGLAIALRITEEHGGTLQLVSEGKPTRFCISLPNKNKLQSKEFSV